MAVYRLWMTTLQGSKLFGKKVDEVIRWKGGFVDVNDERIVQAVQALPDTPVRQVDLMDATPQSDPVMQEMGSTAANLNGVAVRRCGRCLQLVPAELISEHMAAHGRETPVVEVLVPHLPAEVLGGARTVHAQLPVAVEPPKPKRTRKRAVAVA